MSSFTPGSIYEGRFRVERELEVGPYAATYAAVDLAAERAVSLKVLARDAGATYSAALRTRYERELQVLGSLRDPHTVRLFDYGESSDGELFLVFDHVPGDTLREMVRARGSLGVAATQRILTQVLSSLREAHHHGILHRDLSPEHVRVEQRLDGPHAVVVDFGIARETASESPSVTATGELVGTPRYMSPEQILSEALTPASDLYAVGLIGYELLFGSDVLQAGDVSDMLGRLEARPVKDVPPDPGTAPVVRVLERLTERDPAQRLQSAAAALGALAGQGTPARRASIGPVSPPAPVAEPERDYTRWVVGGGVLLSVCAGVAALSLSSEPEPEAPVARRVPNALVRGHETVEVPSAEPETAPAPLKQPEPEPNRVTGTPLGTDGAIPSAGCVPGAKRSDELRRVVHYVPLGYDGTRPYPVVMLIPGDYLTPQEMLQASGFQDVADQHGVLVVVPSDFGVAGAMTWQDADDEQKISSAYDAMRSSYCVDEARTYVLSHGYAGTAATELACQGWFTALVTNGYAPDVKVDKCDARLPRLALYPLDSPHVRVGRKNCAGASHDSPEQMMARIGKLNGCNSEPEETASDGVTCFTFDCAAAFELCRVPGGTLWPPGHQEFIGHAVIGCDGDSEPRDDVTARAWEFFAAAPPLKKGK